MALTKFTKDVKNIQSLSDKPNETDGLTAQGLKERFDRAGEDIKDFINGTLTTEIDRNLTTINTTINDIDTEVGEINPKIEGIDIEIDLMKSALMEKEKRTEYSINEQNTGKVYVDGKDIYVKTLIVTCGMGAVTYDLPEDVDQIVDIRGILSLSGSSLPCNYVLVDAGTTYFISTSTYEGKIYLRNSEAYRGATGPITIEYTKK